MSATGTIVQPTSKTMFWVGTVVSFLPAAMLVLSGMMKIFPPKEAIEGFAKLGWEMDLAILLAVLELGATLIYLIPPTAVLGAILLTGYLGGAISTHVRQHDYSSCIVPVILGVLVWLGLYLRDARVRALIPIRK
jgi:uncharacterized membrane protein YphA (DoxX/SURF4 family)